MLRTCEKENMSLRKKKNCQIFYCDLNNGSNNRDHYTHAHLFLNYHLIYVKYSIEHNIVPETRRIEESAGHSGRYILFIFTMRYMKNIDIMLNKVVGEEGRGGG